MPKGEPFTQLCKRLGKPISQDRVDLHLHTTHSDGMFTPEEVVDLARRSGLAAFAVTDHDTMDGVRPARQAAHGEMEVITGVEITSELRGKELHLLGYFVDTDHGALLSALAHLRRNRRLRFWEMVQRLRDLGIRLDETDLPGVGSSASLGRRHLAEALIKAKETATVREAFKRYLGDSGRACVPKQCLPASEAIALVREAGGVAAWAHPSDDGTRDTVTELRRLGLAALEVQFPSSRPGRTRELRRLATDLGLAVTGGSDCHGPGAPRRAVGSCSVTCADLETLRERAANGAAFAELRPSTKIGA